MRGGGPPGYHKALPLSLVERKEKGKKREGSAGPNEDCMRDLYCIGLTPSLVLSRHTKQKQVGPLCILCWGNNGCFHKR